MSSPRVREDIIMMRGIMNVSRLNSAALCYNNSAPVFCFAQPRQSRQLNRNGRFVFGETMKFIPLTKGKEAIVDDDIFLYLMQWRWYCSTQNRAVRTTGDGKDQKMIYMHRVVMGDPEGMEIDHINMDSLDNRRENLRVCTRAENSANKKKYSTNTSGYKGVTRNRKSGRWIARITINYVNIHLGSFDSAKEAAKAYNEASEKYHGEYSRANNVTR